MLFLLFKFCNFLQTLLDLLDGSSQCMLLNIGKNTLQEMFEDSTILNYYTGELVSSRLLSVGLSVVM